MKKLYLFLLLAGYAFSGLAQVKPNEKLGSKTLYKPLQTNYTAVPKGYHAVYINFIGRHGARHLTKDVKVSFAWRLLKQADSLKMLLPQGLELNKMVSNLDEIEDKKFASISKIGSNELEGIAKRLYRNNKTVFSANENPLIVATTKKGRTKESAEAFLNGLKKEKMSLGNSVSFNYADDDHLRFYDFSKTYDDFKEKGSWQQPYEKLAKTKNVASIAGLFSAKIFKGTFLAKLTADQKKDFLEDIYGFYTILGAIAEERKAAGFASADLNFGKYFSAAELHVLGLVGDAEDFLQKGPGTNADGIQVRIAAPLLADFINSTDCFIKDQKPVSNLRFAHAETIAPFAAIMNIKGASESTAAILNFNNVWQAENIIPFSANIQWVFYKNTVNGNYLVKFLLNEKEVAINGLKTKTFPYYQWTSVRGFYLKKLQTLKLSLNEDMHSYLLNLK